MMSQSRTRKPLKTAAAAGDASLRRGPTAKTHEESTKPQQPQLNKKTKSRSKIPKSLRHELENALVGLCDVWFEEIKPHLLRNNIKVHVHNRDVAGAAGAGAGDQKHERLPSGTPGCSHLDPGAASDRIRRQAASCADCSSTQQMASKAPLRRPRPPPFKLLSPINSLPRSITPEELSLKTDKIPPPAPARATTRRRHRRAKASPPSALPFPQCNWRVPRPCRPYSLSPQSTSKTDVSPSHYSVRSCSPTMPSCKNESVRDNKCKLEKIVRKSSCTITISPSTKKQSIRNNLTRTRSTQTYWTCNNKLEEVLPRCSRKKKTEPPYNSSKSKSSDRLRCSSPFSNRSPDRPKKNVSPKPSQKIRFEDELSANSVRHRPVSPGPRKMTGDKNMKEHSGCSMKKRSSKSRRENFSFLQKPYTEIPSLFADDLIEIIGENHDRLIRMLEQPSRREAHPLTTNLFLITRQIRRVNKQPPWR